MEELASLFMFFAGIPQAPFCLDMRSNKHSTACLSDVFDFRTRIRVGVCEIRSPLGSLGFDLFCGVAKVAVFTIE
jgi:hypothetical protein